MRHAKGFATVLVIALIALLLGVLGTVAYFKFSSRPSPVPVSYQSPVVNQPISSPIGSPSNVATVWKVFAMKEVNISLDYPPDWVVTIGATNDLGNHRAVIKGDNGEIDLTWGGEGYGGGCPPENSEKRMLLGKLETFCHITSDGDSLSILTYAPNKQPYQLKIQMNSSDKSSSDVASKILSTVTLIQK